MTDQVPALLEELGRKAAGERRFSFFSAFWLLFSSSPYFAFFPF